VVFIIWLFALFAAGCAACAVIDLKNGVIPNALTLPLFALGWLYSALSGMLKESAAAFAVVAVISVAAWLLGGLGGGDVKLMAAVAVWTGTASLVLITAASLIGAAWGVTVMARAGVLSDSAKRFLNSVCLLPAVGLRAFKREGEKEITVPFGFCLGMTVLAAGAAGFLI